LRSGMGRGAAVRPRLSTLPELNATPFVDLR
jgi:hypothetical protein